MFTLSMQRVEYANWGQLIELQASQARPGLQASTNWVGLVSMYIVCIRPDAKDNCQMELPFTLSQLPVTPFDGVPYYS